MKPIKVYQIIFSFSEPAQAVATFAADSEEEAIAQLVAQLEGQVSDVEIDKIEELYEIPEGAKVVKPKEPEPQFDPLPDNVIAFPGNTTRN